jgi:hypothetical protein
VPLEHRLSDFTQVVQDMPPIRDLDGLRCGEASGFGIGLAAIPTQDSNFWMPVQPGSRSGGAALVQEIRHLVSLQIHHNGTALVVPPAERKIVQARNLDQ